MLDILTLIEKIIKQIRHSLGSFLGLVGLSGANCPRHLVHLNFWNCPL